MRPFNHICLPIKMPLRRRNGTLFWLEKSFKTGLKSGACQKTSWGDVLSRAKRLLNTCWDMVYQRYWKMFFINPSSEGKTHWSDGSIYFRNGHVTFINLLLFYKKVIYKIFQYSTLPRTVKEKQPLNLKLISITYSW